MSAEHALVLSDMPAARAELQRSQYGAYPNAEELIRGQYASMSPELRAVVRKSENEEATAELKSRTSTDFGIDVPEGGKLRDCVVRGTDESSLAIVYVWEDAFGNLHRGMQGYSDRYKAPPESPQDAAVRVVAEHDGQRHLEAFRANAEVAERVQELREELSVEISERFTTLSEELSGKLTELLSAKATSEQPSSSGASTSSDGKYPRDHEGLDELAADADTPENWDDLKVADKQDWLKSQGIAPPSEDEG